MVEAWPQTTCGDLALFHPNVARLGPCVADNVVRLIKEYARRASLQQIPPVTLEGSEWERPWGTLVDLVPWSGAAGESHEASKGGIDYRGLCLRFGRTSVGDEPEPATLEATVAHEIVHLRWWNLRHGLEFSARAYALLRGAVFPAHTSWSRETRHIMVEARRDVFLYWQKRFSILGRGENPP